MGAQMIEVEKEMMALPYAIKVGEDGTAKNCDVFRNFASVEVGHLIDREDESIHSLY